MFLPFRHLSESISLLAHEVGWLRNQRENEFDWLKSQGGLVTKHDLNEMEKRIMSALSNWAEKIGPKLERIQTGIDKAQKLIEEMQTSPGEFSPEDQATADKLEAVLDAIGKDVDGVPAAPPA